MADCVNHPGVAATTRCTGCAEMYCPRCVLEIQGQWYCGACKMMTARRTEVVATQRTGPMSEKAKAALTCAIISIFCFGVVLGPIGIVFGVQARGEIKRTPGLRGDGVALAAIIIGSLGLLLHLLTLPFMLMDIFSEF